MKNKIDIILRSGFIVGLLCFSGCGTLNSQFVYNDSFQPNIPQTDEKCYDGAVLLTVDLSRAKDIARKVLIGLDGVIKEESDTYVRAVRRMQMFALIANSGGETLTVKLEKVDETLTFVTAATYTQGGAAAKSWSCKIVEEMIKMAQR
jgi:hypothetical protein